MSNIFDELNKLYEASEFKSESNASSINLKDCRIVKTDVVDIRGEFETNSCLDYLPAGAESPILTRVQVRVIVIRDGASGKEFLGRKPGFSKIQLPGGGYDALKDHEDILVTAQRELWEELNIKVSDLKDLGIHRWTYREDPFVFQHVSDPADRWYGYYSFLVVCKYAGASTNDNPEELGKYKWYPLMDLQKAGTVLKKAYDQISSDNNLNEEFDLYIDEAWGDSSHGEQDMTLPNILSYCCESPFSLRKILESSFIRASATKETYIDDKQYNFISTSEQLFSHAYRRPNKWGFGIALARDALEKDIKNTSNAVMVARPQFYRSMLINGLFTNNSGEYMIYSSLYGYVEVSSEIADIILDAFFRKYDKLTADDYTLNNTTKKPGPGRLRKEKSEQDKANWTPVIQTELPLSSHRSANRYLQGKGFNTRLAFSGKSQITFNLSFAHDDFTVDEKEKIVDYLLNETYYDEGEQRIWLLDNQPGLKLSPDTIIGLIVPDQVSDYIMAVANPIDWEEYKTENPLKLSESMLESIEWLGKYVHDHHLKLYAHRAMTDKQVQQITANTTHAIKTRGDR